MSRFVELPKVDITKNLRGNYPLQNIYVTKEGNRVFVTASAVSSLASRMESIRDIALIIDISGSMRKYYKDGSVESMCVEMVEMLNPYDSDGIDLLFYAKKLVYQVTVKTKEETIKAVQTAMTTKGAYGTTMPVEAFEKFSRQLLKKQKNGTVLFLTDGGMDDRGSKMRRFYEEVLHTKFRTRDRFYCYAIEFGKSAIGALEKLDGLFPPEQGSEDLFDIHPTFTLKKLSDILIQVVGMSSIASKEEVHISTNAQSGLSMVNQYLVTPIETITSPLYHTMSVGIDSVKPFELTFDVKGYEKMFLKIDPLSLSIEVVDKQNKLAERPLRKGEGISLTKEFPSMQKWNIEFEWNDSLKTEQGIDLDAQCFMLASNGKVPNDDYFIFYNQSNSPEKSVRHIEADEGNKQSILIDLAQVPPQVDRLLFTLAIYEGLERNKTFSEIPFLQVKLIDQLSENVKAAYDLSKDLGQETAMIVAEIYRYKGEWKCKAIGAGYRDDLASFCHRYGVNLA